MRLFHSFFGYLFAIVLLFCLSATISETRKEEMIISKINNCNNRSRDTIRCSAFRVVLINLLILVVAAGHGLPAF